MAPSPPTRNDLPLLLRRSWGRRWCRTSRPSCRCTLCWLFIFGLVATDAPPCKHFAGGPRALLASPLRQLYMEHPCVLQLMPSLACSTDGHALGARQGAAALHEGMLWGCFVTLFEWYTIDVIGIRLISAALLRSIPDLPLPSRTSTTCTPRSAPCGEIPRQFWCTACKLACHGWCAVCDVHLMRSWTGRGMQRVDRPRHAAGGSGSAAGCRAASVSCMHLPLCVEPALTCLHPLRPPCRSNAGFIAYGTMLHLVSLLSSPITAPAASGESPRLVFDPTQVNELPA